jgi:hypothetical protein
MQGLKMLAELRQKSSRRSLSTHAGAILAVGLTFSVGVVCQLYPLNGLWPWRDLLILRTAAILCPPFIVVCWVLWRMEKHPAQAKPWGLLGLLALSNFVLQVLGMVADPRGIKLVGDIVMSPVATSYFTDATKIHGVVEWLRTFQQADLALHSSTHPPGPILFYYVFVKLFGPYAAQIGGLAVGLLGSLGVLAIYKFARLWTEDRRARLTASAFYALLPALTVFFPEFDEGYPILSMLLIFFWVKALIASRAFSMSAVYLGAALFLATFFAYNLLTIGVFLACYAAYWLLTNRETRSTWITLPGVSGVALGVFITLHGILWQATGFEAIASFRHALANQAGYAPLWRRPYALLALVDPYDFFLGAGIMSLPLLILHLRRCASDRALTLIALGTILTIDLTGLLRGEAARVWLFLQPLFAVPIAIELTSFSWRWRLAIFAVQWWILVCLKARISFVQP